MRDQRADALQRPRTAAASGRTRPRSFHRASSRPAFHPEARARARTVARLRGSRSHRRRRAGSDPSPRAHIPGSHPRLRAPASGARGQASTGPAHTHAYGQQSCRVHSAPPPVRCQSGRTGIRNLKRILADTWGRNGACLVCVHEQRSHRELCTRPSSGGGKPLRHEASAGWV